MARLANARVLFRLGWALLILPAQGAAAQPIDADPASGAGAAFANTRWAMQVEGIELNDECVVGFWTFVFSATGYFTYNNRVRGSWRVDELGNLRLKTREGLKFTLFVEGTVLRPAANLGFVLRRQTFRRCGS